MMKKIVALIIALSMICGLAPNLQLVVRAEETAPIIIIPGIMGSKLYADEEYTDLVWGDALVVVKATTYNTGARLAIENQLYAKGLTLAEEKEYGTIETYENMMNRLTEEFPDRDIYLFSYDWRQSNKQSAEVLKQEMAEKGIEKADFLCHSMGGMVISQYINKEGTDAIKHVVTIGSPLEGASRLLQSVITPNILEGAIAFGNNKLTKSGLTTEVKTKMLGVGELAPSLEYWNGNENRVVAAGSKAAGTTFTYDDALRRIFGDNYENIMSAHAGVQSGVDTLLSMENAYFIVGINQKTMSGVELQIDTDKPADSFESVIFYDCEYEMNGDGTVPFNSAVMMQSPYPDHAEYIELTHNQMVGSDVKSDDLEEWEKELSWLFKLLKDEPVSGNYSEITFDKSPYTVIRVNGPADATITFGEEFLSSGENTANTEFGIMNLVGVDNEIKMFCLDSENDYDIVLNGIGKGNLEYTVRYYDAAGNLYDERMISGIEVSEGMQIYTDAAEEKATALEIDFENDGVVDKKVAAIGAGSLNLEDRDTHEHVYSSDVPIYTWSEDCSSCEVGFSCVAGDVAQQHAMKVTKDVVDPTTSKNGKVTYTAAIEIDGTEYTTAKTVEIPKKIKISSIKNQNGSVKLEWTKSNKAAGYKVYRKAEGQSKYYLLKTIEKSSVNYYTDKSEKSIVNGKKSQYYILPYYNDKSIVAVKSAAKTNYYLKCPTISSLKASESKKLKVTWKKNDKTTGYQVRYSTTKAFEKYSTSTVKSKSTLTKTLKDLKKNKTYYVKIRAYKTVNGKKYYSAWSAVKSKKTK